MDKLLTIKIKEHIFDQEITLSLYPPKKQEEIAHINISHSLKEPEKYKSFIEMVQLTLSDPINILLSKHLQNERK